jgi:hypothetical protein
MRFRKGDIESLRQLLNFPDMITLPNRGCCDGEYAFCLLLWRLHYPNTLANLQSTFGRDYSQLSRIFKAAVDWMYEHHRFRVNGCIDWYADRFDMYNEAILAKIAESNNNPVPGTIPQHLGDIYGFLDCTAEHICRPWVSYCLHNNFVAYNFMFNFRSTITFKMPSTIATKALTASSGKVSASRMV